MSVTVYPFSNNGMVMVFGPDGEQMPEYQGRREDVEAAIRRDHPDAEWKEPFDFAATMARDGWRWTGDPVEIAAFQARL